MNRERAAMTTQLTKQQLLAKVLSLGAADRSMLEVLVQRSHGKDMVQITTTEGSTNHQLWSEFEKLGWLTQGIVPEAQQNLPAGMPAIKCFRPTPIGVSAIAELLAGHGAVMNKMSAVFNEQCLPFLARLDTAVKESGGTPHDLLTMLTMMTKKIIETRFRPEYRHAVAEKMCAELKRIFPAAD